MGKRRRISVRSLLSLLMCAGLVFSSVAPPVREVAEEEESEQSDQGERENLLRQRNSSLPEKPLGWANVCPALSRSVTGVLGVARSALLSDVSETSRRNGLGGPLLL